MICNLDPQYGSECNDCGCAQCPPGQTSDGTGLVTYCPNQYGDSGCHAASVSFCAGYTDGCPGLGYGFLCKDEQQNCGGITGCTKVKACNIETGETQDLVSGNCHIENDTCYSNTRACNMFANRTENYDISCAQSSQQGQAEWNGNAWNVGNCGCDITNVEIGTGPFGIPWWCDSFNAVFHVSSANQIVNSASGKIVYTMSRMYCSKCHPGYLPKIETSAQINDIYVRPENSGNGNWGVGMCNEQVRQPNYATGCEIDFNFPSGQAAYNDCLGICPTGSATESDGATDITQCIADYSQTYEDNTGRFVLESFETCP